MKIVHIFKCCSKRQHCCKQLPKKKDFYDSFVSEIRRREYSPLRVEQRSQLFSDLFSLHSKGRQVLDIASIVRQ